MRSGVATTRWRNAFYYLVWSVVMLVAFTACGAPDVGHEAVTVAVASNFLTVHEALVTRFSVATGHEIRTVSGSNGQLYAQIRNGAPVDVFLAADRERPERLEGDGLGVAGTRFTYARGRLALFGSAVTTPADGERLLRAGEFQRLAVANPSFAPYGLAARQALEHLGLWEEVAGRLVRGENVAQAYQFVATGAAELGLVSRSQVISAEVVHWPVPAELHDPIRQDAILLSRGADRSAARAFIDFLRTDEVRSVIAAGGYGIDE